MIVRLPKARAGDFGLRSVAQAFQHGRQGLPEPNQIIAALQHHTDPDCRIEGCQRAASQGPEAVVAHFHLGQRIAGVSVEACAKQQEAGLIGRQDRKDDAFDRCGVHGVAGSCGKRHIDGVATAVCYAAFGCRTRSRVQRRLMQRHP